MFRKKLSLLVLLILLAFIGTGQFGLGGCQCNLPLLIYKYHIPYCVANNESPDRIAIFAYIELQPYDSQNNPCGSPQRKYLVLVHRGDTVFYPSIPHAEMFVNTTDYKQGEFLVEIPRDAVKAQIIFHVGAHYLLNDNAENDNAGNDEDDGIEAYLKDIYLLEKKVTGWTIIDSDLYGVYQATAEILPNEVLHGKFIGGHEYDIDQGYVTFAAEVALK